MYTLITLRVKHFLALREAEREKKKLFYVTTNSYY